ncbi:MAG: FHA domain-containing protein [Deltaproteobacteria bacterium]|nr:FHA domain-containing protein [Deltaproteobacteria bacterium]MBT6490335.1 FHA domain-containing protein [Deltaproteobacteria bacterium]
MSDKSTSDEHPAEENDGEHTVIDSEWGDKFKELEEKYGKDDSEIGDPKGEAVTQEVRTKPLPNVFLTDDSNAKTSLDYKVDSDEAPTLDPAQGPFLPQEPSTMADRPLSKNTLTPVSQPSQTKTNLAAPDFDASTSDDLVGPGFSGSPSDSFSDADLGDDWGVTGHAQTGAWGVDETAFLQVDPTSDTQQGIDDIEPPESQADPFAQVMGRLVCTDPGLEEQSVELVLGEASVGRSSECDFTLDEPSVSRLHATIVAEVDRVRVLDAGSNNGTFVNGRRVDEVVLKSRDEISFGTVNTRFLAGEDEMLAQTDEAKVAAPAATPPADRIWKTIQSNPYGIPVVISGVLIFVTALVALGLVASRDSEEVSDVKPDKVFQYFLDGVEAFKARKWDLAEEQFKILKGLDSSHTETLEYLDAVGEERRAENNMELARTVRKQGHLRAAKEYAQGATGSIYQQDVAKELIASIELEVDARLARARVSLEAGQFGESTKLLEELDQQYPERSDVRALLAFVRGIKVEQGESQTARGQLPSAATAQLEPAPEEDVVPTVHGRAQELFLQGKLDEALELLEQEGTELDAHMLAAQIHKFQSLRKVAHAEHRAKRSISALKALDSLIFIERQIVSEPSVFRPDIDKKRADMHYLGGVEALAHKRFAVAARRFKRALGAVATYEKATRQLANMVDRASELAGQAQSVQAENPSKARKIWGDVLAMTPDEHPLHRQAVSALKKQ